jgi:hypothetical protein
VVILIYAHLFFFFFCFIGRGGGKQVEPATQGLGDGAKCQSGYRPVGIFHFVLQFYLRKNSTQKEKIAVTLEGQKLK